MERHVCSEKEIASVCLEATSREVEGDRESQKACERDRKGLVYHAGQFAVSRQWESLKVLHQ